MTEELHQTIPARIDTLETMVKEIHAVVVGSTVNGVYYPGQAPQIAALTVRVTALEKIIAQCTAFFLAIATLVAGAWALLWYGPHK